MTNTGETIIPGFVRREIPQPLGADNVHKLYSQIADISASIMNAAGANETALRLSSGDWCSEFPALTRAQVPVAGRTTLADAWDSRKP